MTAAPNPRRLMTELFSQPALFAAERVGIYVACNTAAHLAFNGAAGAAPASPPSPLSGPPPQPASRTASPCKPPCSAARGAVHLPRHRARARGGRGVRGARVRRRARHARGRLRARRRGTSPSERRGPPSGPRTPRRGCVGCPSRKVGAKVGRSGLRLAVRDRRGVHRRVCAAMAPFGRFRGSARRWRPA